MEVDLRAERFNRFIRRKRGIRTEGDNPRGLERVERGWKDGLFLGKSLKKRSKKYLKSDLEDRKTNIGRGVNHRVLIRGKINKLLKKPEFEHLSLNWLED